ncbi:MAG: type II/IV secretion system protein [Bacteroidales bacterium]|nr:type II/IV secretion system protein [Bacteroidales bacterium]
MKNIKIDTEALQVFSADEAQFYRLLPYGYDEAGRLLCLGIEDEDYTSVSNEISMLFGKQILIEGIEEHELSKLLATSYRATTSASHGHLPKDTSEMVAFLIDDAYSMRASDIHMEPSERKCRIRYRVDGRLLERHVIPASEYTALVNRVKIMSSLDISEKRLPQDGRILYESGGIRFDIRTSILPTIHGEKIVLRLLTMNERHMSISELGMDDRQYEDYVKAISHPHGMILISGPTGSGKSTTLYATLERLNRGDNNILTIEDPVEYTLDGINQVQLKEEIGLDFPSALRTFLRQDPDIIMLGEIRDEATAEMAVRSSLTGHLLLSTLHTNSAWGCITRMTDMGIHPYLLSETLVACIAQRLVRTLCPHCRKETGDGHYAPVGCPHCFYTGYLGRKAIYEVIPIDSELSMAIREGVTDIGDYLKKHGIKTLKDSAVALYNQGETSKEEILQLID